MSWKRATDRKRALQGHLVPSDALDRSVRNRSFPILQNGRDVDGLPGDGCLHDISMRQVHTCDRIETLTLAASKMSLTDCEISGPMPSPSIRLTGYRPF